MKKWFSVQAKADDQPVEVSIYDDIGWWGMTAKDFEAALKPHKGKALSVSINSNGGDVFQGIAIYNMLKAHGGDVEVRVMGLAASIASVIAMAGKKIKMPENAYMMIHNPWSFAMGDSEEMRKSADVLDKISESLVTTYVARTGKSADDIKAIMAEETWLSAADAVEMGFADEMEPLVEVQAHADPDLLPEKVRLALARKPEPVAPEVTPNQPSFADQVKALATQAGLGEYAATFALKTKDVEEARAAIKNATEIVALCKLVGQEAKTGEYVRSMISEKEVRAKLADVVAEISERSHVDTSQRSNNNPSAQAGGLNPAEIWAARRKAAAGN